MIGSRRFHHGATDSTNERAFAALATGDALHGDVHVASSQSAGRGRLGRRWESAPGEGLYLSVVLLPESPLDPVALTMATGLVTLESVRALGLGGAWLDWPNDVVVDGAKLAGVLVESRGGPGCVLGIGINVSQERFSPELERERPVTSMRQEGVACTPDQVETELCRHLPPRLEQALERSPRLASDFLAATHLEGRPLRVDVAGTILTGICAGLDLDRGLAVQGETGRSWAHLAHVRSVSVER